MKIISSSKLGRNPMKEAPMKKWLVWYTTEDGRGDSIEVEAPTKDAAGDYVMDNVEGAETIDNVEELR